ncbi:MAG TPA: hypothetical protein VGM82_12830 [Gemmatimonadaceae bacterium]
MTAGIDFGLTIAADLDRTLQAQAAQLSMQYNPAPPFNAGSRETAPADVLALIETRMPGSGMFRL